MLQLAILEYFKVSVSSGVSSDHEKIVLSALPTPPSDLWVFLRQ